MQDNNPERRNLIAISLAILIYFLAGGELADDVIRIQLVNLVFQKPIVLSAFVWVVFIWFLYRYWLLHTEQFTRNLREEIKNFATDPLIRSYAESVIGHPIVSDREEGMHIGRLRMLRPFVLEARLLFAKNVSRRDGKGDIAGHNTSNNEKPEFKNPLGFSGARGKLIASGVFAKCFLFYPSFSSYVAPYVLATLAVLAAIWHVFF